ncbi:MAG: hypothetical protein D6714_17200 [Bacteroidetes bacterium]|nr:MAG: hypothetical protein D6714_17200 [Bacteroidota bacterium]
MRIVLSGILMASLFLGACSKEAKKGTTPNGFEYEFHVDKEGPTPQPGEYAYFQAEMRNGDQVTLNSRSNPVMPRVQIPDPKEAQYKGRPSAVVDALSMMSVGDSLTVYQLVEEGTTPPPGFKPGDKIAFDISLKEIKTEAQYQSEIQARQKEAEAATKDIRDKVASIVADYSAGALDDQIKTTASGLKYLIYEQGDGPKAEPGKLVSVNYFGVLTNGSEFDNSYKRGRPYEFTLGSGTVIKGWDEGIALFNEGGKGVLFVPPSLGYGDVDKGTIPPNSELIFYISLEKVQ